LRVSWVSFFLWAALAVLVYTFYVLKGALRFFNKTFLFYIYIYIFELGRIIVLLFLIFLNLWVFVLLLDISGDFLVY
jgi:hypothetical protein